MLFKMPKNMGEKYSPLYFLASVGAGGLVITFFMYLMFWIPHPGKPVPVFEDIIAFIGKTNALGQAMIAVAILGIAFFTFMNIRLLVWNLLQFKEFKKHDSFPSHQTSNAQTQVMAMPLALAMTVNASFIVGLVFVPNLWSVVEYLFPLAMITFVAIGVLTLRMMASFMGRVLVSGGFSCAANNSFAQMLPAFAFAMVGVGLSAPAAMSMSPAITGIAVVLSTFFFITATIIALLAMFLGLRAMMEHGAAAESAPTLLIVIPMLTVLGILILRQDHGLHVHFQSHNSPGDTLLFLSKLLSVQVLFGLFGLLILKRQNYAAQFLAGTRRSAASYALICPGVALSVMLHFFINKGLVGAHLVDKFSIAYWVLTAVALVFQIAMIRLMLRLNNLHFGSDKSTHAVPAE